MFWVFLFVCFLGGFALCLFLLLTDKCCLKTWLRICIEWMSILSKDISLILCFSHTCHIIEKIQWRINQWVLTLSDGIKYLRPLVSYRCSRDGAFRSYLNAMFTWHLKLHIVFCFVFTRWIASDTKNYILEKIWSRCCELKHTNNLSRWKNTLTQSV